MRTPALGRCSAHQFSAAAQRAGKELVADARSGACATLRSVVPPSASLARGQATRSPFFAQPAAAGTLQAQLADRSGQHDAVARPRPRIKDARPRTRAPGTRRCWSACSRRCSRQPCFVFDQRQSSAPAREAAKSTAPRRVATDVAICAASPVCHGYAPQVAVVGNRGWPRGVSTVQAATEGRHSSQPLASPCIEAHGMGARAAGAQAAPAAVRDRARRWRRFCRRAAGSNVTAQSPGSDENVFFSAPNRARSSHPIPLS